jgi:hypothetical protein
MNCKYEISKPNIHPFVNVLAIIDLMVRHGTIKHVYFVRLNV